MPYDKKRKFDWYTREEILFFLSFVFGIFIGTLSNISSELFLRGLIIEGLITLVVAGLIAYCVFFYLRWKRFLK
jgi:hypothetical protein